MNYSRILFRVFLTACITLVACAAFAQDNSSLPYMNPKLTPEERAADLVHRMTLEEKGSQLVNQARAIPRLKVPAYDWWSEALHGVVADGTTEFPEPIGLAATFDTPRIHEMATAIGIEVRIGHLRRRRYDYGLYGLNPARSIPRWASGFCMNTSQM
jgi:beta-glucosidase